MAVYIINEITVTNPELYRTYADQVPPTLETYGGTFAVRGGDPEQLDGPEPPQRVVMQRFESREAARTWRNSPEYQAILAIRDAASASRVYIVDAYEG